MSHFLWVSDFVKQFSQPVPLSNPDAGWVILSPAETRIRRKIEEAGKPLKEWDIQINYGIKTGFNDAFIINGATKDELIRRDPRSAEIIRPILKGRDIKPFYAEFSDRWVIFTRRGVNIENYPAIYEHLLSFRKGLEPKPDDFLGLWAGRKGGKYKWYEIQDSVDYWKYFEQEKIVWLEISDVPKFCYDDKNFFIEATAFFLIGHHLHYLLCILNSKISQWYLDKITASTGAGTNRWKKVYLEKIPIPKITESENLHFKLLAQKIITASEMRHSVSHLEAEVACLLYKKYGLTDEEVAIIDKIS